MKKLFSSDRLKFFWLFAIAVVVLTLSPQAQSEQSPTSGADVVPIDIVLRLLNLDAAGNDGRLFVGQLPEGLPIQPPLPNDATILASVVYYESETRAGETFRILVDLPQRPNDRVEQYEAELAAAGWQRYQSPEETEGGFVSRYDFEETPLTFSFCREDDGQVYTLLAIATPWKDDSASMDLVLYTEGTNCQPIPQPISSDPESVELTFRPPIPVLYPPPGAIVESTGSTQSNANGGIISVYATAESELSAADIAQHYASQWALAGWSLLSNEGSGDTWQSIWTWQDENEQQWQGTFSVSSHARQPGFFQLEATVESVEIEP